MSVARCRGQVIAGLLGGALAASTAWSGGTYLVQGRGVEYRLEIGGPAPKGAQPAGDGWYRTAELEFRTASGALSGPVVLIRCRDPSCLTDRGVLVGDSESDVLRRYGGPQERSSSEQGALMRYNGVGFLVEAGRVRAIYILPP